MQVQREIRQLKKFVVALDKKVRKMSDSVIIEPIDEEKLTPSERRHLKKVRKDVLEGKMENYISIDELKAKYGLTSK
ncbi:MAG: hypothetical protein KGH71_01205 [Candidatus Micrarchaeota archaeon]|nr:hypothetical protein [Candidatus Micrarchaeota archaeon]